MASSLQTPSFFLPTFMTPNPISCNCWRNFLIPLVTRKISYACLITCSNGSTQSSDINYGFLFLCLGRSDRKLFEKYYSLAVIHASNNLQLPTRIEKVNTVTVSTITTAARNPRWSNIKLFVRLKKTFIETIKRLKQRIYAKCIGYFVTVVRNLRWSNIKFCAKLKKTLTESF